MPHSFWKSDNIRCYHASVVFMKIFFSWKIYFLFYFTKHNRADCLFIAYSWLVNNCFLLLGPERESSAEDVIDPVADDGDEVKEYTQMSGVTGMQDVSDIKHDGYWTTFFGLLNWKYAW